jgi:hypothetical protein
MERETRLADGQPTGYGMAWYITPHTNGCELSHDGASGGFSCQLASYTHGKLDIAIATNSTVHIAELLEKRISGGFMRSTPMTGALSEETIPIDGLAPISLTTLSGVYRLGTAPVPFWIQNRELHLRHPHGRVIRLQHARPNVFVDTTDGVTVFTFDEITCEVTRLGKHLATLTREG